MDWLFENGNDLLVLFLTPLLGLVFDYIPNRNIVWYLILWSFALALPYLAGYEYIIPYSLQILGLLFFGGLYSLMSTKIRNIRLKTFIAALFTLVLTAGLGFCAFIDSMSGNQLVQQSWRIKNYRIDHVMHQGFSGRAVEQFEISKYTWIPLLKKRVDAQYLEEDVSCLVHFQKARVEFNKCTGSLKQE